MSITKHIVCRDDSTYNAFPDVVLSEGGKLICVFTECNHHGDRNNSRIAICESSDRGRSWTPKKYLTHLGQKADYYDCARISRLRDNSLIIVCDKVKEDENMYAEVHMWKSDAEGASWSGPIVTPARGIVPDKLLELECGRWLLPAHFKSADTGKLEQYLWYSDDKGASWSERVTVAADPRYNLCEATILQLPNGTLAALMRENSGQGWDCMKALSYNNGATWEGVYSVPIPACHRPVAGMLKNGVVMITHRFMQGGRGWLGSWTQNVFAAFMAPEQIAAKTRSEQSVRIMSLDYDRSPVSDLGYTGWVQFEDGEIYVVNYIVDDAPKAHIRGYSFYYDDVVITR